MNHKGVLIGIVLLFTGNYMIILSNSLYFESNQLDEYASKETYNEKLGKISDHIFR